jgi:hypothetical protein
MLNGTLTLDLEADLVLDRIPDDPGPSDTLFLELRCQAAILGNGAYWRPELVRAIKGFAATRRCLRLTAV